MIRADFTTFDERAHRGEELQIVFFGGSLTWGAQATDPQLTSYRPLMAEKFRRKYPSAHFCFWDAAIGGTGSQLGAFRLERDVLSRRPDLVFLDFSVNDGPSHAPNPDKLASYESLVRHLIEAGVPVVQVIFAVKRDVLPNPPLRLLDDRHKEIAHAYRLPVGDAVALMRQRVADGTVEPDQLWPMPHDATHPGDDGYALYAEAAWSAYEEAVKSRAWEEAPTKMLHAPTYLAVNRSRLAVSAVLPHGWRQGLPHRSAVAYDFIPSRWLDNIVVGSVPDQGVLEPLRLKIRATNILLWGEATPRSGKYHVIIDGRPSATYDSGASAKEGNLRYVEMIAEGLDPDREHLLEIVPQLEPGQELRLESVCVAGSPATVSLLVSPVPEGGAITGGAFHRAPAR